MRLFSVLITFLVSLHTRMYTPWVGQVPVLNQAPIVIPSELLLSQKRLGAAPLASLSAESYLVIDQHSGEFLVGKNHNERLFPASTTKIMTALVVIETLPLTHVASVGAHITRDGSDMNLVAGEQIAIKDLLAGILIHSANDAAILVSEQYPGGTAEFVQKMNTRARELGMYSTHFTNPTGYQDPDHYTSVRDLLVLAREAMKHPEFREFVSKKSMIVTSVDGKITHRLETTNELLGKVQGIEGIKTGWTEESGECLVTQTTRNGQTILTAVLKSADRFGETKKLIEWSYASFIPKKIDARDLFVTPQAITQ